MQKQKAKVALFLEPSTYNDIRLFTLDLVADLTIRDSYCDDCNKSIHSFIKLTAHYLSYSCSTLPLPGVQGRQLASSVLPDVLE